MRRAALAAVALLSLPSTTWSQACTAGFASSFSSCYIGSTHYSLIDNSIFPTPSTLQLFLTPIHSITTFGSWTGFRVTYRDPSVPAVDQGRAANATTIPGDIDVFTSLGASIGMTINGNALSAWKAKVLNPELAVASGVPGYSWAHWGLAVHDGHSTPTTWFDGATAESVNGAPATMTSHTEAMPAFGSPVMSLDFHTNHKVAAQSRDFAVTHASSEGWEFQVFDAEVVPEPVTGLLVFSGLALLALEFRRKQPPRK